MGVGRGAKTDRKMVFEKELVGRQKFFVRCKRPWRPLFLFPVLTLLMGCGTVAFGSMKELCSNNGFELGSAGWQMTQKGAVIDFNRSHSGKASLRCRCERKNDKAYAFQYIKLSQKEPIPVAVSAWSMAEKVSGPTGNHYSLWCDVEYQGDFKPGKVDDWFIVPFDPRKQGWQKAKTIYTPKHPIKGIRCYLLFRKFYTGTAWFDDISVKEVSKGRLSGSIADVPEIDTKTIPEKLSSRLKTINDNMGLFFLHRQQRQPKHTCYVKGRPVSFSNLDAISTFDLRSSLPATLDVAPPHSMLFVHGLWDNKWLSLKISGKTGERLRYFLLFPKGVRILQTTFKNWDPGNDIGLLSFKDRLIMCVNATADELVSSLNIHFVSENKYETSHAKPTSILNISTRDGLSLRLGSDGKVWGLSLDGEELSKTNLSKTPYGLLVGDGFDGFFYTGKTTVEAIGNGILRVGADVPQQSLKWKATYTALPKRIVVQGEIYSESPNDRPVDVLFRLPIGLKDLVWWDDISHHRNINKHSLYKIKGLTLACVTRKNGKDGIGIALSPDMPCVFELGFNSSNMLYVRLKFALSPLAKLKKKANFSFSIFRVDGHWGLRDAAKRYYDAYPYAFKRRATKQGMWLFAFPAQKLPNPWDYAYHEGGQNSAKIDEKLGIFTFPYILPGQLSITHLSSLPDSYDEVIKELKNYKQHSVEKKINNLANIIECCAVLSPNGKFPVTVRDNLGADVLPPKPINMIVFPVNCDPDLFFDKNISTVAKLKLDQARGLVRAYPLIDGIYVDSVSGWVAKYLNSRRDHFRYADYPLTYEQTNGLSVIDGRFSMFEFLKALGTMLHASGRLVFSNLGCSHRVPWLYYVTDVCGIEGRAVDLRSLRYFRTMAYQKPVLRLDYISINGRKTLLAKRSAFETYFKRCTSLGIYPSIGRNCNFIFKKFRDIYQRYMPILKKISQAGWEPVTHAKCKTNGLSIERFGPRHGKLYFTIYNETSKPTWAEVDVDFQSLGIKHIIMAKELVVSQHLAALSKLDTLIPPNDLRVVELSAE